MNGKKRLLSLALCVVMVITQFSMLSVSAVEGGEPENAPQLNIATPSDLATASDLLTSSDSLFAYYELANGGVQIVDYLATTTDLVVPAEIDGKTVVSLGNRAFYGDYETETFRLPDTIKHIGWNVFTDTKWWNNSWQPDGTRYIGNYLVSSSGYYVTPDYSYEFDIDELVVKEGTTLISDSALDSNIDFIYIPKSVQNIGMDHYIGNYPHVVYEGSEEDWGQIANLSAEEFYPHHYNAPQNIYKKDVTLEASCARSEEYTITCTAEGCGKSRHYFGERLDHEKGEVLATVEPTCGDAGFTLYRCKNCTAMFKEWGDQWDNIPHTKGKVLEVVSPGCYYPGYTMYECAVCGSPFPDDYTDPLRYEDCVAGELVEHVKPSCENYGQGCYKYECIYCENLIYNYYDEEYEHDYELIREDIPTCENAGCELFRYYTCKVCGAGYNESFWSDDHHNYELVSEETPSCKNYGQGCKTYQCSNCEDSYTYEYWGDYSCNYELVFEQLPSCKNGGEGYKEYKCTICEESNKEYYYLPVEHDYQVVSEETPSCENGGYGRKYYKCTVCDETYDESYYDYENDYSHVEELIETVQPTADSCGYNKYECTNCGLTRTEGFWGGADKEHDFEILEEEAPSCKNGGRYYVKKECKICGWIFEDAHYDYENDYSHDYQFLYEEASTCKNNGMGYIRYKCTVCGDIYDESNWGTGAHDHQLFSVTPASCINGGQRQETYKCTICEDTYTDYISDNYQHDYELIYEDAPSCENGGYSYELYKCTLCGDEYSDSTHDPFANSHKYVFLGRTAQTCTSGGYNLIECSVCGDSLYNDIDEALGHIPEKFLGDVAASCIYHAGKQYECALCDNKYVVETGESYGTHNFKNGVCTVCTGIKDDIIESPHNYTNFYDNTWTVTKKCDRLELTFSESTYTEADCDFIYIYGKNDALIGKYSGSELSGKTIKIEGNTAKIRLTTDVSQTHYGFLVIKINAVCDHKYDSGVVTKKATCKDKGTKTYTCTKCGHKKDESIAKSTSHTYSDATCTAPKTCKVCKATDGKALGHKYSDATCTAPKTCSRCKATSGKALGHKYDSGKVTKAATYDATGEKTYTCTRCKKATKTSTIAKLAKTSLKKAKITVKDQTYSGSAKKPSITVKLGSVTLKKDVDYKVTYSNNKNIGKATVKIEGIKKYKDTASASFKINPKKVSSLKVKAGKSQMTVSWKKDTKVKGYQIQYATNSKFTKGKKTVKISSYKTYKKTIKKLKAKKTYYVRVRSYKKVGSTTYYGAYTSAKKVKIK